MSFCSLIRGITPKIDEINSTLFNLLRDFSELEGYHNLTEEAVDAIIADSQLPAKQYEKIKNHVMGIFSPTPDQH